MRQGIPLLVVNLDRSPERLAHMRAELGGLDLPFARIRAVDGRAEGLADEDWGISAGEVGCFESHRLAWRRIVAADWPCAIVMEDDVHVHARFRPLALGASWVPPRAEVVKLDTRATVVWLGRPQARAPGDMALRPLRSASYGSGAYLVRRAAAERLLAATRAVRIPLDLFLFGPPAPRRWCGTPLKPPLRVLQCCPAPVISIHRVADRPELASMLEPERTFGQGARARWKAGRRYRLTRPLRALTRPAARLCPAGLRLRGARPERVPFADGHVPAF